MWCAGPELFKQDLYLQGLGFGVRIVGLSCINSRSNIRKKERLHPIFNSPEDNMHTRTEPIAEGNAVFSLHS